MTPTTSDSNNTANKETANYLFGMMTEALHYAPDYKAVYTTLNSVFQLCLNHYTADSGMLFGGTFAKTDYLLKEKGAKGDIVRQTNDTRVRLRRMHAMTVDELRQWCYHDVRNIARFVSLVCEAEVPHHLATLFPQGDGKRRAPRLMTDCMRLIVDHWDEEIAYCRAEDSADGNETRLLYTKTTFSDCDWSYLGKMFYRGAQVNALRPRRQGDEVIAEIIVFEPDYLVDISTVARCFTNYTESPLVNMLKRLEPSKATEATLLGNFASQLLDEQIHLSPDTPSYAESATVFWQNNAVSLLTTNVTPSFHNEAKRQKANIAHAVDNVLPKAVGNFDPKECVVEPSFFSEMLGLQGRMDLLQLDFRILIEQKSGKGEYPYGNFNTPKAREEHYVQMLLYMMLIRYNYRETYKHNGNNLSALLLYSKYDNSLLKMGFAPDLMFRAMKVRNQIAWTDIRCARNDGFKILETLTPDQLNTKHTDSLLWKNYQKANIAKVLTPIQQASDIERRYFFRWLKFISVEHLLSKMGNHAKDCSGFASLWLNTLDEKLQAGCICHNLTLTQPDSLTTGSVRSVCLRFNSDTSVGAADFRVGDIVIVYPYDKDKTPDVRQTMVFRSTVEDLTANTITLRLRSPQTDPRVFTRHSGKPWAVEHDFMESSFNALYKGVHAFLSAPRQRRDLLLLQREPSINTTRTLCKDYGCFNSLVLKAKQADDLLLVIGPPGTGKTSFGLLYILQEHLTDPSCTALLLAYTNRAVDEICSKLHKQEIDYIRIGGELTCPAEFKDHILNVRASKTANIQQLRQTVAEARVVVAVAATMGANLALLDIKQFSIVIADEASQLLEPHLLGIVSHCHGKTPSTGKLILIGDHKQLPAVVQQTPQQSAVDDPLLRAIHLTDCRQSLFERLLRRYHDNPDVVYMMTRHGRMHTDIALFPNIAFYNNQLQPVPLDHQLKPLDTETVEADTIGSMLSRHRVAFVDTPLPDDNMPLNVNLNEAAVIADIAEHIYRREQTDFQPQHTLGIIVPYRNQIAAISSAIGDKGIAPLRDISIDTVERYQGSQRKYIVYGFTVRRPHQLLFLESSTFVDHDGTTVDRRLNVAMTRAEQHLVVVGNATLLKANPTFRRLIEFVKSRDAMVTV